MHSGSSVSSIRANRLMAGCLLTLTLIAGGATLYYTRTVMVPFVLALFLRCVASPFVNLLQSKLKLPRPLAIVATFLAVLGVTFLVGLIFFTGIRDLLASADIYQDRLLSLADSLLSFFASVGLKIDKTQILQHLSGLPIFDFVKGMAGGFVSLTTNGVLVFIFLILLIGTGKSEPPRTSGVFSEIEKKIRQYLITKIATSLVTAILIWLVFLFAGLELALVFGLAVFVLNFIPSIGGLISALLPLPIALIQYSSWVPIVVILAVPAAIQFVMGNVIEPKLFGKSLDLHEAAILLSLMFWGLIWGIMGMILAVPLTVVLRITLEQIEGFGALTEIFAGRIPTGNHHN